MIGISLDTGLGRGHCFLSKMEWGMAGGLPPPWTLMSPPWTPAPTLQTQIPPLQQGPTFPEPPQYADRLSKGQAGGCTPQRHLSAYRDPAVQSCPPMRTEKEPGHSSIG